jgi:hypothetical protein
MWVPCRYMSPPDRVHRVHRVAANVMNMQSRTADKG